MLSQSQIFFFFLFLVGVILLYKRFRLSSNSIDKIIKSSQVQHLRTVQSCHETASALLDLIEEDGAGVWPPRCNHENWPTALRPYKSIYLELIPLFPAAKPSLDDDENAKRIARFRDLMRKMLAERIDLGKVKQVMRRVEKGDWSGFPRDGYNGFYCCVAVCRHAYRWGTIPVVKVAQLEKVLDFPPELDVPWPFLQRKFGVTAESGNNTANVLHNFDEKGDRVYKINVGLSELVRSSEEAFFRMFYTLEVLASPIYHEMVQAVISFEVHNKESCTQHLQNINSQLRTLLLVFFENLTESRVSHSVWLSYVQGFQGWGVGRIVDGEFIKYDGLSGNHVLFFQALDAFLGMDRYLTDENMLRYIPFRQRELCLAFKRSCFRGKLDGEKDAAIGEEIRKIVNQMKLFRAAHRARVMPYLEQPAPERLTMTAGKSVLEDPSSEKKDIKTALAVLDQMLEKRLKETV